MWLHNTYHHMAIMTETYYKLLQNTHMYYLPQKIRKQRAT